MTAIKRTWHRAAMRTPGDRQTPAGIMSVHQDRQTEREEV